MADRDFTRADVGQPRRIDRATETWQLIRQSSIVAFAQRTARLMGGGRDKMLLRLLNAMAVTNGDAEFVWAGHKYTGELVLRIYSQGREPGVDEPFKARSQWQDFADAMRKLRDPDVPLYCRERWLAIGVGMEARQLPHAQRQGWAA